MVATEQRQAIQEEPETPETMETPNTLVRARQAPPWLTNKARELFGRGNAGPSEYLDVKFRIAWLRWDFPQASVQTRLLHDDGEEAVFLCDIALPDGGHGSGHGSETKKDFGDFREKAETKAVGRALNNLGYSIEIFTALAGEDDDSPNAGSQAARSNGQRPAPSGEGIGSYAWCLQQVEGGQIKKEEWPSFWNNHAGKLPKAEQNAVRAAWNKVQAA